MSTTRMNTNSSRAVIGAILALGLLLSACGSDSKVVADGALANDDMQTLPVPTTIGPTTTLPSVAGEACKPATDVPEAKGKPTEIKMPDGKPPAELESEDLKVGDGDELKLGDPITVNYVGIACSTGKQFDSSWDNGAPFSTTLAEGSLIKGWTEGLPGMKVGGRRRLVIPADLAYADKGQGPIAPDETLVFIVDLISVAPPTEPPADAPTTVAGDDAPTTTEAP